MTKIIDTIAEVCLLLSLIICVAAPAVIFAQVLYWITVLGIAEFRWGLMPVVALLAAWGWLKYRGRL